MQTAGVLTAFAVKKLISSSVDKATTWSKSDHFCASVMNTANQISFSRLHCIHEVFLTSLIAAAVILIASLHRQKQPESKQR